MIQSTPTYSWFSICGSFCGTELQIIHGKCAYSWIFFFGRAYPKYSLIIFTFVTNFINFQILILM